MKYQAFACYNSKNYPDIAVILEVLSNAGCSVFCDKTHIKYGDIHQSILDDALKNSASVLVFIGPNGLGPWQKEEILSSIWESINGNRKIVIPVLLHGAKIDHPDVPTNLRNRAYVEFKETSIDLDILEKIIERLREFVIHEGDIRRPLTYHESRQIQRETIKVYNDPKIADMFYEKWKSNMPIEKIDQFLRLIPKTGKILDAGCGPGHHTNYIANQGFDTIGIDLSHSALNIAHKSGGKALFLTMDMSVPDLPRNAFDGIWACSSCIHTPREFFANLLLSFRRSLKLGGYLGITLMVDRDAHIEQSGRFFESWTQKLIEQYLEIAGFEVEFIEKKIIDKSTFDGKRITPWTTFFAKSRGQHEFIRKEG